jgi:hypothetical protein
LQSLLTFNPDHRISASRALTHPYFCAVRNDGDGDDDDLDFDGGGA